MKSAFFIMSFLMTLTTFGQSKIKIDFEKDGIMDNAEVTRSEEGCKIIYTLSSQNNKEFSTELIIGCGDRSTLSVKNKNVLVVDNQFMRGENVFKFRYETVIKQVKLIGYDNTQYGTASNDGSGSSSYNLSTGVYQASWNHYDEKKHKLIATPKISKKMPLKTYILKDFNDNVIDELYQVDYQFFPSFLK